MMTKIYKNTKTKYLVVSTLSDEHQVKGTPRELNHLKSWSQTLPSESLEIVQWWPDTNLLPAKLMSQSVK